MAALGWIINLGFGLGGTPVSVAIFQQILLLDSYLKVEAAMDIPEGSTNQWIRVRAMTLAGAALTGKNAADFTFWYARHGASVVSISPLSDATAGDEHADGSIYEEGQGWYWIAVPDEAFTSGVPTVGIGGTVVGGVVLSYAMTLTGGSTTVNVATEVTVVTVE